MPGEKTVVSGLGFAKGMSEVVQAEACRLVSHLLLSEVVPPDSLGIATLSRRGSTIFVYDKRLGPVEAKFQGICCKNSRNIADLVDLQELGYTYSKERHNWTKLGVGVQLWRCAVASEWCNDLNSSPLIRAIEKIKGAYSCYTGINNGLGELAKLLGSNKEFCSEHPSIGQNIVEIRDRARAAYSSRVEGIIQERFPSDVPTPGVVSASPDQLDAIGESVRRTIRELVEPVLRAPYQRSIGLRDASTDQELIEITDEAGATYDEERAAAIEWLCPRPQRVAVPGGFSALQDGARVGGFSEFDEDDPAVNTGCVLI